MEGVLGVRLVYVAAVLFYKPIFTQPLRFVLCAAGAVEKSATERAVSVVYLRDSICISKINAAFLTGQQIDRIVIEAPYLFLTAHSGKMSIFSPRKKSKNSTISHFCHS